MYDNEVPNRILCLKDSDDILKQLTMKLSKDYTNLNSTVSIKDKLNDFFEAILALYSSIIHGENKDDDGKDLNKLFQNNEEDGTHEDDNEASHDAVAIETSILHKHVTVDVVLSCEKTPRKIIFLICATVVYSASEEVKITSVKYI